MSAPVRPGRLFSLLPAVYRARDAGSGRALEALMAVIEEEYSALVDDVRQSYDNWFIETCEDWVVPYLAPLAGIQQLGTVPVPRLQRRTVAGWRVGRQHRGSISALEHTARAATGWPTHVVEHGAVTARTQHVRHIRPGVGGTAHVGVGPESATQGTPFASTARTVAVTASPTELRASAAPGPGDHEPSTPAPDAGPDTPDASRRFRPATGGDPGRNRPHGAAVHVWRLRSYPVAAAFAGRRAPGCFTFDPGGIDTPLLVRTRRDPPALQRITPLDVPAPITRAALAADLARPSASSSPSALYGPEGSIDVRVAGTSVPAGEVRAADLTDWFHGEHGDGGTHVLVDPRLGRLQLLGQVKALAAGDRDVVVAYSYGAAADIGGGPYSRTETFARLPGHRWQVDVASGASSKRPDLRLSGLARGQSGSLAEALDWWTQDAGGARDGLSGVVLLRDDTAWDVPRVPVVLPVGCSLSVLADDGCRPTLRPGLQGGRSAHLTIRCPGVPHSGARAPLGPGAASGDGADERVASRSLVLDGLRLLGRLTVSAPDGSPGAVTIALRHCTLLAPGGGDDGVTVDVDGAAAGEVVLTVSDSIVGSFRLPPGMATVSLTRCVVDGHRAFAAGDSRAPGPAVHLDRVTAFGEVRTTALSAVRALLAGGFTSERAMQPLDWQFSWAPPGSSVPGDPSAPAARDLVGRPDGPDFTSTRYGDPGYAQLSPLTPIGILAGADDSAEIGAFHDVFEPQALSNLLDVRDEFLPIGVRATVFYAT